jgi:Fe2+ transport system protein FeoA
MQNPDRQTYEMGLFRGAKVQVLRNDNEDNALLICTGNTRYMISKSVAKTIVVNHCTAS